MVARGITHEDVRSAIAAGNQETGGGVLTLGEAEKSWNDAACEAAGAVRGR